MHRGVRSANGRHGVLVRPDFLAVGGIQTANDLVALLAREDINLAADQRGRRVSRPDGDLPFLCQFLGPSLGRGESGGLGIAIGAAPLRPILPRRPAQAGQDQATRGHRHNSVCVFHSRCLSIVG